MFLKIQIKNKNKMEIDQLTSASMSAPYFGASSTISLQCTELTSTVQSSAGPSPPTHRKTGAPELAPVQKVSFRKYLCLNVLET